MNQPTGFRLPHLLLPRPDIDLSKWAVVACDQYTAEPDYWQRVAHEVGDAPSTLQLIFPEAFLGDGDAPARIQRIQQTMRRYLADGLLRAHDGTILVERRTEAPADAAHHHGPRTRRGLMLELDLEHYDFSRDSTSLIRPTEGTIVERLAPRIEVRRGAELELPHILVLIDDPACTVIEPLAATRASLPQAVRRRADARRRPRGRSRRGRRRRRACAARVAGAGRAEGVCRAPRRAAGHAGDALRHG